jgi:hypothetical protein
VQSYLPPAVNPEPQLGPRKLVPGPASQVAVQPAGSLRANPHGPAPAAFAPDTDLASLQAHVTELRVVQQQRMGTTANVPR